MAHFDGTPLRGTEKFIPTRLLDFLLNLEKSTSTEDVWTQLVQLGADLGLDVVDYVFANDFRNWEKTQFIRTTIDSRWFDLIERFPHMRYTSNFRTHGCRFLTPMMVGPAYLDDMGPLSEDKRRHVELSAKMGLQAGLAIPLRMESPNQAAMLTFGGQINRASFDAILDEHGWTLHAAALSAHTRYSELFRREFTDRNHLTEKQNELICLVGQGLMDKQIAYELGISFSAVRQRLASVQQKTGAHNRAHLAALAMRAGLVPDPVLDDDCDQKTVLLATGDGMRNTELPSTSTVQDTAAE